MHSFFSEYTGSWIFQDSKDDVEEPCCFFSPKNLPKGCKHSAHLKDPGIRYTGILYSFSIRYTSKLSMKVA